MVFKKLISVLTIATLSISLLPSLALAVASGNSTYDLEMYGVYVDDSGYLSVWMGNSGTEDVSSATEGETTVYVDDMDTPAWTYSWSTMADEDLEFLVAGSVGTVLRPEMLDGVHTVMACVDATDVVDESNEDNNCATEELENGFPNLVLQDIYLDGDGSLNIQVGNESDIDIDASTAGLTSIFIDDMETTAWSYTWTTLLDKDFLNAWGESIINPQSLEGSHEVKACVDYYGIVEESDEEDNCLTVALESDLPDLVLQEVFIDDDFYLNVVSGNEGDADVDSTTAGNTYIYIDEELSYTYAWTSLNDKSFLQVDGSATISPGMLTGAHTVEACVDAKDVVEELNEENNCLEATFDAGLPDLVLQDIYLDGDTLSIQIGNEGEADAEITTGGVTYIWVDGELDKTYSWKTLADQSFVEVDGSSILQPFNVTDDQTIEVCVDYLDSVEESDEDNNCMEESFTFETAQTVVVDEDLADLVLQDIYIDESNRLSVQVGNEGVVDSDTEEGLYIYIDDFDNPEYTYNSSTLSESNREFLVVDGVSTIQPLVLDDSQSYDVKACVDPANELEELDDDNNCMEVTNLVMEIVYDYVADTDVDDVDDGIDEVDKDDFDDDVFSDFEELWTDSDYPDLYYLTVKWGYVGDDDDIEPTSWDGSVNFENSIVGRPIDKLGFEDEDFIDFGNTNPTMTSFDSTIYNGKDGILFKIKADLDDDGDGEWDGPFIEFNSEYSNTSLEVFLDDLVEDGYYKYEYADGYQVMFNLIELSSWFQTFKDTALLQVRIGNLDGNGSTNEEDVFYNVNLSLNEGSIIRSYMPMLLEVHEEEGYDYLVRSDDKSSMELDAGLFGHMDGFLSLVSFSDSQSDRYIEVVVEDENGDEVFDEQFGLEDELGIFELDDGTGNQIMISDMFKNRSDLLIAADQIFSDLFELHAQIYRLVDVIDDVQDTGELDDDVLTTTDAIIDSLLDLLPGDDEDEDPLIIDLRKDLAIITSTVQSALDDYNDGTFTGDELNDKILNIFGIAKEKLEEKMEDVQAAAGYMLDADYDAWYAHYMDVATAYFFSGYKDAFGNLTGHIGPADNLTRLQLIKIMSELADHLDIGLGETSCESDTVDLTSDVDWMEDHWAEGYVQCIYNSGLELTILDDVIGTDLSQGTSPAYRWEVIQLGFEILGIDYTEYDTYSFPDVGDGSGLYDSTSDMIQTAVDNGIVSGYPDGYFRPFNLVNRAEMFKMITLLYEFYAQESTM
mgnify:CR=1 FL=1